jgi:Zn-dependent peptidase ImmA (M78 family)/transcriptional regulator with XRE-family HTH domain
MPTTQKELGSRLKDAREAAGLTQLQAAQDIGLARSAIAQIESGGRSVSGLELEGLAYLYGRDMRELVRQEPLEERSALAALFRAAPAMAEDDAVTETLRHAIQVGRELTNLERLLAISTAGVVAASYEVPRPRSRWQAIVQGNHAADEERRRLGLGEGPMANLSEFLEGQGIRTAWIDLPDDISGMTLRDPGFGWLVVVNARHPWERRRFSYAHEYAHVLFDRRSVGTVSRASNRAELEEVRANAFAASFLLPAAGVASFLVGLGKGQPSRPREEVFDEADTVQVEGREEPGSQEIQVYDVALLAHHFRVSRLAALYRLKNLKVVSDPRFETLKRAEEEGLGQRTQQALQVSPPNSKVLRMEFKQRFLGLALEAYRRNLVSLAKLRELAGLLDYEPQHIEALLAEAGLFDQPPARPRLPGRSSD